MSHRFWTQEEVAILEEMYSRKDIFASDIAGRLGRPGIGFSRTGNGNNENSMRINEIYLGDALDHLKSFPDEFANCVVTSPPYYRLRDYGNDRQIGLEDTYEDYIAKLVAVFHEVKRVLKKDGTLWINIGDSYAGSGKGACLYPENAKKYKQGSNRGLLGKSALSHGNDGLKSKNLIGIPWMLAFALRDDGWYLRQDIIWSKPNPMPESVSDRCTRSHEYIFLLSKSPKYYFDAESIAEPVAESTIKRLQQDIEHQAGSVIIGGGIINQ